MRREPASSPSRRFPKRRAPILRMPFLDLPSSLPYIDKGSPRNCAPEEKMNERSLDDYTVVLRPDDNGTVVAYGPAIPGCHAWGRPQQRRTPN